MLHPLMLISLCACAGGSPRADPPVVYVFPFFQDNGQTGLYLAISDDGLRFESVNGGEPVLPAPDWPGGNLVRDPSILYRDGLFHLVWTTGWETRSIGYASSRDLVEWSEPRRVALWPDDARVRNTWAPELHYDDGRAEYLILWSSTTLDELGDGDGTEDPHGYDHRIYASRTTDFETFTPPAFFYSPDPEHGVIDAFIARDDRATDDPADDRFVMVVKNEMGPEQAGKNLRLAFADRMEGPYSPALGMPVAGAGTPIVNHMAEGPTLLRAGALWRLYWDAPGGPHPYCLATSPDLLVWTDRSDEIRMPVAAPRHGTVLLAPADAVGWLPPGAPRAIAVEQHGAMREVLREGKSEARIALDDPALGPDAVGVGAMAGLDGEVTILDGQIWVVRVRDAGLTVTGPRPAPGDSAALLTLARVPSWSEAPLETTHPLEGDELEARIDRAAHARGVDTGKPFPFVIRAGVESLAMHVINGFCPIATDPATIGAEPWTLRVERPDDAIIVGFYAPDAAGVMTHHGTSLHAHALLTHHGRTITGHIEELRIGPGAMLKLPR